MINMRKESIKISVLLMLIIVVIIGIVAAYPNVDYVIGDVTSTPVPSTPVPSGPDSDTYVSLYGEKTNVVLSEDILLRLSAVNLISKPVMTVQVILYPPSGMSITAQEFVKSGAGIYTTTYKLDPGDSKDIEIKIKPNQIGDFDVKGVIVYYFGGDKDSVKTITKMLPIKVGDNKEDIKDIQKAPGFEIFVSTIILLMVRFSENMR